MSSADGADRVHESINEEKEVLRDRRDKRSHEDLNTCSFRSVNSTAIKGLR
jgi:hypothetical protein